MRAGKTLLRHGICRRQQRMIFCFEANGLPKVQAKRWPSQTAFAKACGLHRSHLADIERGAANIKLSTLLQIARTLKITLADLLRNIV